MPRPWRHIACSTPRSSHRAFLKIVAPETLTPTTFLALALAPQVDAIIKDYGEIRLLIDASHLEGWDSLATLEKHAGFVKAHQAKVARIAVVARRDWQHRLVGAVKVFLHPEVKSFDPGHESDALRWIGKADPNVVTTGAGESIERLVADVVDGH
jgi:hypothetical protein